MHIATSWPLKMTGVLLTLSRCDCNVTVAPEGGSSENWGCLELCCSLAAHRSYYMINMNTIYAFHLIDSLDIFSKRHLSIIVQTSTCRSWYTCIFTVESLMSLMNLSFESLLMIWISIEWTFLICDVKVNDIPNKYG